MARICRICLRPQCLSAFANLLFLNGCVDSPASRDDTTGRTVAAAPECPAEDLSCGKQVPRVASANEVFANEDMGIETSFEDGERVCVGRSGDSPRGFYTFSGAQGAYCESEGTRSVGIHAWFNATHQVMPDGIAGDCRPPQHPEYQALATINWPGDNFRTLHCFEHRDADFESLTIYALAKPRIPGQVGLYGYYAHLSTVAPHRAEDIARFRRFLNATRVSDAQVEGAPD